ncbi:NlpC/P60 family protein [Streptomyces sparsogenes]|uniref:C40 family peptidase n=1 Tax=Streptomyces sparsogenes TaxID=67365 RepID=UPI0038512018
MASHRKPRARILDSATGRRTAVSLTTAALASVTLLSQTASAEPDKPKPSIEEVKKKVDTLYHQAESATQGYNAAKERTGAQRAKVDKLLDGIADRAEKLNEARRALGTYAAAQYRGGGMASSTATLLFASDPQGIFDQSHLMDRLTEGQKKAVANFRSQQAKATEERAKATESLAALTRSQEQLKTRKKTVQDKLTQARQLLSELTAEEKARLAAIERKKAEEARRKAAELARKQREAAAERQREQQQDQGGGSGATAPSGSSDTSGGSYSTRADKAVAFARSQLGKPYVWGATGPNSYDCSGLTQAAWKAAGVSLPRTTWDQVKVGTRVSTSDLQPGDLVFFYDDISHVGLYIGDGMMIHAPKPGDVVKEAPITEMPIYGSVRPA